MSPTALNLSALIEFNKYTLAIAAAAFVYALQTFIPAESVAMRWLVLGLLLILLTSLGCGALLFAACTRALHEGPTASDAAVQSTAQLASTIERLGKAHAGLLFAGLALLSVMVVPRVLARPAAPAPLVIRCAGEGSPTTTAPPVIGPR
jgi:hypothetical protein